MKELNISRWVLIALFAISFIVIGLFFAVGYSTPWEDNPKMVNPQFTDLLLWWTIILLFATLALNIYSVIMQIAQGSSIANEKGLAGHTNTVAMSFMLVTLIIGFFVGHGSTEMLMINGVAWDPTAAENTVSNVITDMSIVSIGILSVVTILVTILSVIAGATKK